MSGSEDTPEVIRYTEFMDEIRSRHMGHMGGADMYDDPYGMYGGGGMDMDMLTELMQQMAGETGADLDSMVSHV